MADAPGQAATLNTLGAILYRAGRFQEAVQRLGEAMKANKEGGVTDWLFLAMAHHHLKHTEESRSCLRHGIGLLEATLRKKPLSWQTRVTWSLLRREAEVLVGAGP